MVRPGNLSKKKGSSSFKIYPSSSKCVNKEPKTKASTVIQSQLGSNQAFQSRKIDEMEEEQKRPQNPVKIDTWEKFPI